jgi:hypothetical protein
MPSLRSERSIERAVGRCEQSAAVFGNVLLSKAVHGRLYFGEEYTILKDRKKEVGRDLLAKMCRDLNIDPHDL